MSTQERDHALTRNCCGGGESMIHFIHYPRVELRRGGYVHAVYLRDFTKSHDEDLPILYLLKLARLPSPSLNQHTLDTLSQAASFSQFSLCLAKGQNPLKNHPSLGLCTRHTIMRCLICLKSTISSSISTEMTTAIARRSTTLTSWADLHVTIVVVQSVDGQASG